MKLLHGCAEMRWMPSRHYFALFRLIGWLRLRHIRISGERDRVISVHPDQSGVEVYGTAFWALLTVTCYLAPMLSPLPLPLALGAALPLAWSALQIAMLFAGLVVAPAVRLLARRPGENNLRINSFTVMSLLAAASSWVATERTWARFAAWQFLALVALNAMAAAVMFLLRDEVARLESFLGGDSSEASSLPSH
jgi:hypothetical protein